MENINLYIDKTEKLLNKIKKDLADNLLDCENDLVSYEIRESILKIERKDVKFKNIKNSLLNKYNKKEAEKLKILYNSVKIYNI